VDADRGEKPGVALGQFDSGPAGVQRDAGDQDAGQAGRPGARQHLVTFRVEFIKVQMTMSICKFQVSS